MTLAAAWIETNAGGNSPLCFASDSRTSPGPIEGVTKTVLFGRGDLGGVWAGDFRYASLLIGHLDAVFTASDIMRRRDVDVARALRSASSSVQRHLTHSTNPRVPSFQQNSEAQMPERTVLLAGGYSIVKRAHLMLRVEWHPQQRRWRMRVDPVAAGDLIMIGDETRRARKIARQIRRLRGSDAEDWRMEPLAVIHNACEDRNRATVGGRLQLAKAYMHGSTSAYGFVDHMGGDTVYVRGARVNRRAAQEIAFSGRLIDLSAYRIIDGAYATRNSL